MGFKASFILVFLLAVCFLISSARELEETAKTPLDTTNKAANKNGVKDAKDAEVNQFGGYQGGYGGYPGGGYGGYPGGGYGGYPGGGYPGGGYGGYPGGGYPGGGYPGGRYCRYGCCGRRYYGGGCQCCYYAGQKADSDKQTKPGN